MYKKNYLSITFLSKVIELELKGGNAFSKSPRLLQKPKWLHSLQKQAYL